jgi:hypothetical protein
VYVTVPIVFIAEPTFFALFLAAMGALMTFTIISFAVKGLRFLLVGGLF